MAEEEAVEKEKKGGIVGALLGKLGVVIGVVLLATIAALVVFIFVIRPKLADPGDVVTAPDRLPSSIINIQFEEAYAALVMSDPNIPSSTLLYQVSVTCSNPVAAGLVTDHQDRFIDKIGQLHRGRTREEIDDDMVVDEIKRQMVQEMNKILRQLQGEVDEEVRIIDVLYVKFFPSDL